MERTDIEQWKGREVARLLALVETERRYYQEMVATLPVALAVLSSSNVIVSANRAFRNAFGLRPDEIRRRNIDQIMSSAVLLEKIEEARGLSSPQPSFYLQIEGRLLRTAIIPLKNWDDDTEVETLLMVSDVTDVPSALTAKEAPEVAPVDEGLATPAPEEPAATTAEQETLPAQGTEEQVSVMEPVAEAPLEAVTEAEPQPAAPDAAIVTEPPLPAEPLEHPEPAVPVEEAAPATEAKIPPAFASEKLPAVLWTADASTLAFTQVSASAEAMFGYPAQEWMSKPDFFSERIHADDRDATIALYKAAVEHQQEVCAEFRTHDASGNIVWCREVVRPISESTLEGVLVNIGTRKELEQQKVLAARHSALQNLSAQLAHDLNNPLMIITGYAEELLSNTLPHDSRRADLEQILAATQRIAGVTGQLLQFTRKPESSVEAVDLEQTLRDLKEAIERASGGPHMVSIHAAEPVWAMANREQLSDMILALVAASHEIPTERLAVTCDTAVIHEQVEGATLEPGTYARITVHNDGPAVDLAKRAAIFEQILTKVSPEGPALTHAYALVRAWGGDLAFTSAPSQGSRFTVYLPLIDAPPVVIPEPPAVVVEIPVEPVVDTILVVDDEPGIRALVAKILRREHYIVLEAGSATEAESVAAAHPGTIRLLLTDVMLPDRSGRHVAEQLTIAFSDLRVLYISGFTDDESVRAGDFPPGSRFLQKPFTVGALIGKVREALS